VTFSNNWFLLLRAIPEVIAIIGLTVFFSKRTMILSKIIIAGIVGGFLALLIRLLPVKFGIHLILTIIVYLFIANIYLNVSLKSAASGVLFSVIILLALEWFTVSVLFPFFGLSIEQALEESDIIKFLLGLPNLIIFYILFYLAYIISRKKNRYGITQ
jgi:hypothetical protein